MNTNELLEWSKTHQVVERTKEGFTVYLENWFKGNRRDYLNTFKEKSNLKVIRTKLDSIQLTHINGYADFVYCNLDILYLGESIGTYRCVFALDGTDADDTIHFDRFTETTIREGTVKVEIVKKALQQGYSIEEIAKLVELDVEWIRPLFEC
ncbi:hypothetical protein [Paenibacillus agilis]|uniref:Uncharacterized protein n=1 Tax=Paenibacillus agilis TaxID=3020863 RepID=A0A559J1N0_9BACL|nr:hypothetical protein [Paenibacillus agilis]TVX93798.1 hypothetical protein FPZ44_12480 [Paenibacillus agilis]